MTKERKAAIEQWEIIRKQLVSTGPFCKPESGYAWMFNCWFCQYVGSPNGHNMDNGCRKCPLWKWADVFNGEFFTKCDCGCSGGYITLYSIVTGEHLDIAERLKACDLIIRALKGEHIWEERKCLVE